MSSAPLLGVGFIYRDIISDTGWAFAHDAGRKAILAEHGPQIAPTWVEDVPTEKEAERILRMLVRRGLRLIFQTTPNHFGPTLKAAKANPKVRFEQAGSQGKAANLRTFDSRMYEGAYLAGVVAGGMTKNNKLGVVASVPTTEVICDIDSFTLGAQSVNPTIETHVFWVNSHFDPPKEAEGAKALLDGGADVLLQTTSSTAVLQAAEKEGKLAFGWYSDMSKFAPNAHLASAVTNWGPYYKKAVRDTLSGTWKSGQAWWGVKESTIDLVSVSNKVPDSLKQTAERVKKGLSDGTFAIWKGPIVDQKGKQVLKPKQVGSDAFLRRVNFYVKGVSGTLPKGP